jgi:short-subunit dehydrogenase
MFSTYLKQEHHFEVKSEILDVTQFESHKPFYENLNPKPEIVFCCIGYYENQLIARNDYRELQKTIVSNFTGVVSLINIISKDFESKNFGNIVVLSSVAGIRGRRLNYIYGSAKAGLTVYLSGLRNLLFEKNVQITTILLGPVYTRMSEGHKLMPWITLQPRIAAKKIIFAGIEGKDEVYIHWIWKYIMFAIRQIPEWIFKRLPPF